TSCSSPTVTKSWIQSSTSSWRWAPCPIRSATIRSPSNPALGAPPSNALQLPPMRAGIRSRPWAGLDIGSFSVKLLCPHPSAPAKVLTGEAHLPALETDRPHPTDVVAQAISDCFAQIGMNARVLRGITLGVSGVAVIVKQITLPLLDESEVGPALRFEARKHLPFDPQTMTIDNQMLGRFP